MFLIVTARLRIQNLTRSSLTLSFHSLCTQAALTFIHGRLFIQHHFPLTSLLTLAYLGYKVRLSGLWIPAQICVNSLQSFLANSLDSTLEKIILFVNSRKFGEYTFTALNMQKRKCIKKTQKKQYAYVWLPNIYCSLRNDRDLNKLRHTSACYLLINILYVTL